MRSITTLFADRAAAHPWLREALLAIYYLAVLLALTVLYGQGDFATPAYIYQAF